MSLEEQELRNESAVILFQNLALKKRFYEKLRPEKGSIVVFDCGAGFMDSANIVGSCVIRIEHFDDLLSKMNGLMNDEVKEVNELHLNTLIIENISTFYWTLRSLSHRNLSYSKLRDLVDTVKEWYKCNVIVTTWDSEFEK